jgi:hypothetical protein
VDKFVTLLCYIFRTEQKGVVVTLKTYIREVLDFDFNRNIGYRELNISLLSSVSPGKL